MSTGTETVEVDELQEARAIVRELIAVCPVYALPLELMWRIQDTPRLSWVLAEHTPDTKGEQ